MPAPWWEDVHRAMWGIPEEALPVLESAREVARHVVAPLVARGVRSTCQWVDEKASVLRAFDDSGLNSLLALARSTAGLQIAVAAWELAWVDGGAATSLFSGSLAQTILRSHGTLAQRGRYLNDRVTRHGAICITEPIPGAGAEALLLDGSIRIAERKPDGTAILEVEKRGRFTSHMEFADFVMAAVAPVDATVRTSCLVILEPSDRGLFDRGAPVRKLGHQLSSTTCPRFELRVPPSRILGGFTMEAGTIVPNFSHREALDAALRQARTVTGLMTASKLLSAVATVIQHYRNGGRLPEDWPGRLVDTWAAGEAAAALGFSAARVSDQIDLTGESRALRDGTTAVVFPASKLFATAHATCFLDDVSYLMGPLSSVEDGPGCLGYMRIDALAEAIFLGPEAVQRREISALVCSPHFLPGFDEWTADLRRTAAVHPELGAEALAAGMGLWRYTFDHVRNAFDEQGAPFYSDARQGMTFLLADAMCFILAARAFAIGVRDFSGSVSTLSLGCWRGPVQLMADLSAAHSARAAGMIGELCARALFGYAPRLRLSSRTLTDFGRLRARLDASLYIARGAHDRAALSLQELAANTSAAGAVESPMAGYVS